MPDAGAITDGSGGPSRRLPRSGGALVATFTPLAAALNGGYSRPAGLRSASRRETGSGYSSAMPKMMPGRLAGQARTLLRCGIWAGTAFAATFLAEGALRDGYRPLRHPVSSLALGPRGWIQTANFAVTGAACLVGAAGLRLAGDHLAGSRTGPPFLSSLGCPPRRPATAGAAGGPASRPASRSTALPPRRPCPPPWRWPGQRSAGHPGWAAMAACSSGPAS
jgi:hypothetical protein